MDVIKMAIRSSKLTEKELFALKKKIEDGKAKIAELKGKKDYMLKELSEKWGCKDLEEAEKTLAKIQSNLDTVSSKLDSLLEEIAQSYSNDEE
jgi:predicted nuclease with TOPRIM domain